MVVTPPPRTSSQATRAVHRPKQQARSTRTRSAILDAAEQLFARYGFQAARLEDISGQVGIRRASLFYYFKDKQTLYDSVLENALSGLLERVETVLSSAAPLPQRIEDAVTVWVDYVGGRPTLARLLLREVADATPDHPPSLMKHAPRFVELIQREVYDREKKGLAELTPIDPVHLASIVAGSTIFFVAAMPTLVPEVGLDPLSAERLKTHRDEVLRIVRRLAGTRGPRVTRQ